MMKLFFFFLILAFTSANAAITLYNPLTHGSVGSTMNITFGITGTACQASTTYIALLNTNTSVLTKLVVTSTVITTHIYSLNLNNISNSRIVNATGTALINGVYQVEVGCVAAGSLVKARSTDVRVFTSCLGVVYGGDPATLCTTCYANYAQTVPTCIACNSGFWGINCDQTTVQCALLRCSGHGSCNSKDSGCNCDPYYASAVDCSQLRDGVDKNIQPLAIVFIAVVGILVLLVTFLCVNGCCGRPKNSISMVKYDAVDKDALEEQ
jgi:hypothetical protein